MFLIFIYFQTLISVVVFYDQTIVKIDSLKLSHKKTRMMMRVFSSQISLSRFFSLCILTNGNHD